jgi:hypothetical protein
METFTGWQYLLIDVANNSPFDTDKLRFRERIAWTEDNYDNLEQIAAQHKWKDRPLFIKATMALREVRQGKPTGHMVAFDAVNSGMQIMSVLSGCQSGAEATGLVNPDKRADAYTECTAIMEGDLGKLLETGRKKVKNAVVTSLYGSKAEPKKEFGDNTPELASFYKALFKLAPGACTVLQTLLDSWQPWVKYHAWKLPDGFTTYFKVRVASTHRITVDELGKASFKYQYYKNEGKAHAVKNAANVVHSIDAYIMRCLIRRCNYDRARLEELDQLMGIEQLDRDLGNPAPTGLEQNQTLSYYQEQYARSGIADVVILPHLDAKALSLLATSHLKGLRSIVTTMLEHPPFEVITIHDDFKCHPNNMNQLRRHYRDILCDIAESTLLADVLSQIHGVAGDYPKLSTNLSSFIRNSNYALS